MKLGAHFHTSLSLGVVLKINVNGPSQLWSIYNWFSFGKFENSVSKGSVTQISLVSSHIPKRSFITWVAILNRLSIEDRLVIFGIKPSSYCSLCPSGESDDHLFFNCPFSTQVWNSILSRLHVMWPARSWTTLVTFLSKFKGKSLRDVVIRLAFTTSVYDLWIERNMRKFQNKSSAVEVVVHKISQMIRARLLSLPKLPQGS